MATAKFQSNLMSLQANMLNFAYMLTSNRDDAYDLLQEIGRASCREKVLQVV